MDIKELFNLNDKLVVVTGANGLLGKEFVKTILSNGGLVAAIDLEFNNLTNESKVENNIKDGKIKLYECDITNEKTFVETKEKIISDFPQKIEGLVNCAARDFIPEKGLNETGRFEDYPIETLDKTLNLNISAQILSCKLFGSIMAMNKKGSIVNISSIYGLVSPDQKLYDHIENSGSSYIKPISYSVSKSSLLNMTRYLATYWGEQGVRVNTLTLGGVYNGQDEEFVRKYEEKVPLERMANLQDYNGPIIFLLSDASSYMTGANIVVDGGLTSW